MVSLQHELSDSYFILFNQCVSCPHWRHLHHHASLDGIRHTTGLYSTSSEHVWVAQHEADRQNDNQPATLVHTWKDTVVVTEPRLEIFSD